MKIDDSSIALIKKGKVLTMNICGPCHYDNDTKTLSGKRMLDIPDAIGKVFASNITNEAVYGITDYTAGELAFLLKTGIKRTGEFSPFMVKPNLADSDLKAIIAFLKSDDPLVIPTRTNKGTTRYTLPGKIAVNHIFKPVKLSGKQNTRPSNYDTVALGKYLVDIMGCYECHSANFLKIDKINPEKSKGYMAGGNKVKSGGGGWIRVPNLTFDKETGIGNWREQEFSQALIKGIGRNNTPLSYPMPIYSYLPKEEAVAIYYYLKSIPSVRKRIRKKENANALNPTGVSAYQKYSCSSCHGISGKGVADLTKAFYKYSDQELVNLIKNPPSGMPAFDTLIQAEEYPELVRYVKELGRKANKIIKKDNQF